MPGSRPPLAGVQELAGAGLLHHALEHRVVPREGGVADLQVVAAAPSQRGHAVMGELNKNERFTRFNTRDTTKNVFWVNSQTRSKDC